MERNVFVRIEGDLGIVAKVGTGASGSLEEVKLGQVPDLLAQEHSILEQITAEDWAACAARHPELAPYLRSQNLLSPL